MGPLCLCSFLAALDLTIITPAIPTIVSSLSHSSTSTSSSSSSSSAGGYIWIGSAFILSYTAATPLWGTLADIWGRRLVMLSVLAIFFAGSLLCALAPTMDAMIGGRVVLGLGWPAGTRNG